MADVVELYPKPKPEDKCSFCGRPKSKAEKMMTNGNGAFICNVCIVKAKELIDG